MSGNWRTTDSYKPCKETVTITSSVSWQTLEESERFNISLALDEDCKLPIPPNCGTKQTTSFVAACTPL